jgi:TRAP-type mannitol/chloroaromatic compound transport system substrate-binding protein
MVLAYNYGGGKAILKKRLNMDVVPLQRLMPTQPLGWFKKA